MFRSLMEIYGFIPLRYYSAATEAINHGYLTPVLVINCLLQNFFLFFFLSPRISGSVRSAKC